VNILLLSGLFQIPLVETYAFGISTTFWQNLLNNQGNNRMIKINSNV
jgi:hypothetical protein